MVKGNSIKAEGKITNRVGIAHPTDYCQKKCLTPLIFLSDWNGDLCTRAVVF
jgi:hypothetical protein